ncbi:EutP/PduV family microcompartment system protein [Escherichia coli]|nr:EutP/PduV family microcompartment system protein [Escherichia coli]
MLVSACEADIIALVLNADAPWSPFFARALPRQ